MCVGTVMRIEHESSRPRGVWCVKGYEGYEGYEGMSRGRVVPTDSLGLSCGTLSLSLLGSEQEVGGVILERPHPFERFPASSCGKHIASFRDAPLSRNCVYTT